jgi:uncharacterized membrane protein YeaQ/YmgE (transglycosylase-associated protein family)
VLDASNEEGRMGILWTILIGFIVGLLARLVHPGRDAMGFILTTLLGVGGALLATWIGQALHWYAPDQPAGFIGATIGAVILLVIYDRFIARSGPTSTV